MGIITEQTKRAVEEAAREKSPLVWLDKTGEFASLALKWKNTQGAFPYPVFAFDGSFLELLLESRKTFEGKHQSPCVVYMKGFDDRDIKQTPMYETCKAGRTWSVSLERMIREAGGAFLSSEQIEHILKQDVLNVETAEKLADTMANRSPEIDVAVATFGNEDDFVIAYLDGNDAVDISISALKEYFNRVFGCTDDWITSWTHKPCDALSGNEFAEAFSAYLLCLEYSCDLSIPPRGERLSRLTEAPVEYRTRVNHILKTLRRDKPKLYAVWAERAELGLTDEEKTVDAAKLGKLDTFRFEADIMLDAALDLLVSGDWSTAFDWATPRLEEALPGEAARTFWVRNDPVRERIWKWINVTASLGREIKDAIENEMPAQSAIAAFDSYVSREWRIDRLHRKFKLVTATVNTATVRNRYDDFLKIRSAMNILYRSWVDSRTRGWNALCAKDGFAAHRDNAQRFFFGRMIEPALRAGKKTALVLVDAFRFELGEELASMLADFSNGEKIIQAMLAELPTVTAVGMNALMPVTKDGSLDPVFDKTEKKILGFRSGERQVTTPDTRQRALAEYADGRCEWTDLALFLDAKGKDLTRMNSAKLLVIATPDIDTMGESGTGALGINYFDPVLSRLKEAVEKLRDGGFNHIVITADHGFLLGDETVENGHASRLDKADRRHAFDIRRNGDNLVSVPLSDLGWKTEDRETALVLDAGTHLLTSVKPGTFYHGGNSLQERVIPLIVLSGGAPVQMADGTYRIVTKILEPVFGIYRILLTVECCGTSELFAPESVELRLTAVDDSQSRITIGEAGGRRYAGDTFDAPIGMATIVSFRIETKSGNKTRITVSQVSTLLAVTPVTTSDYFESVGLVDSVKQSEPSVPAAGWTFPKDCIPEEYETALRHLEKFGALTEAFIRNSLGGSQEASRKARRFAQRIAEWQQFLPFTVTVRQTTDGTEYRKE